MGEKYPAHNVFQFDQIIFSSNFDNGNLAMVEKVGNRSHEFKIWTAPDNMGTSFQSRHSAWFHFVVTGLPLGCVLRIQVANASSNSGLYKYDMRPVYRCNATNNRWTRIKSSMRFQKEKENSDTVQLFFEHGIEANEDKIYFAFTYPYTYTMLQNELEDIDRLYANNAPILTYSDPYGSPSRRRSVANNNNNNNNILTDDSSNIDSKDKIFYMRELLTNSCDGRRVDLITISSCDGQHPTETEPFFESLFPDSVSSGLDKQLKRPPKFPNKDVIFISARVHPGEVPAQHTFKGILNILLDREDLRAKELRARYVFKLIPMLNPDGVFRGHFRMDQFGQNLNRYYTNPDFSVQPSIFAAKSLLDYYSNEEKLAVYLDYHAHASKRGCFIYGNVLETVEDQVQNQLFCKLIALNTPHFDYEGCLFSKEHMCRIDPGDQAKGLTAEGSGRVFNYLQYKIIHSYTIECNYNTSKIGNEVPPTDTDPGGQNIVPASSFNTNPEKYNPSSYAGVGSACVIAILDLKGHNPCSRIPKSKFKTLERIRNSVVMEVRGRKEYHGKLANAVRRNSKDRRPNGVAGPEEIFWKRVVDSTEPNNNSSVVNIGSGTSAKSNASNDSERNNCSEKENNTSVAFTIAVKPESRRRRSHTLSACPTGRVNSTSNSSEATETSSITTVALREEPHNINNNNSLTPKLANFFSGALKGHTNNINHNIESHQTTRSVPEVYYIVDGNNKLRQDSMTTLLNQHANDELKKETSSSLIPKVMSFDDVSDAYKSQGFKPTIRVKENSKLISSSIKDLEREQNMRRLVSVSNEQQLQCVPLKPCIPLPPSTNVKRNSSVSNKDNRKMLGKTLHAAGVALILSPSTNSSDNLAGLDTNNNDNTTIPRNNSRGQQLDDYQYKDNTNLKPPRKPEESYVPFTKMIEASINEQEVISQNKSSSTYKLKS